MSSTTISRRMRWIATCTSSVTSVKRRTMGVKADANRWILFLFSIWVNFWRSLLSLQFSLFCKRNAGRNKHLCLFAWLSTISQAWQTHKRLLKGSALLNSHRCRPNQIAKEKRNKLDATVFKTSLSLHPTNRTLNACPKSQSRSSNY